jgi:hypothetical protein
MVMCTSARSRFALEFQSMLISGAGSVAFTRAAAAWTARQRFELARVEFEAAWKNYLPQCSEADFTEYRRQRAWTSWKYAMHDAHCRLPTQLPEGRARCFCTIDVPGMPSHVYAAHMTA